MVTQNTLYTCAGKKVYFVEEEKIKFATADN